MVCCWGPLYTQPTPKSEWRFSTNMARKLRAGILGYGRMGRGFVAAMQESELWDIAPVYDISNEARRQAQRDMPDAAIYDISAAMFNDRSIVYCTRYFGFGRSQWCALPRVAAYQSLSNESVK
jgi:hypothetical protein